MIAYIYPQQQPRTNDFYAPNAKFNYVFARDFFLKQIVKVILPKHAQNTITYTTRLCITVNTCVQHIKPF